MKRLGLALCLAGFATTGLADDVPEETVTAITAKLSDMKCQMDPDDIEPTGDGGYDLDDVICEGGQQFDIELDSNLNEVGRRAE